MLSPYYARLRSEIERFGGTVEKFIGDAVMAVFGAPVTHEDDPERAVRAALAARDAVQELNEANPALDLHVRIAREHRRGGRRPRRSSRPEGEGMVAGDVVNTAARLQTAAPVDGILVGETTYRATERDDRVSRERTGGAPRGRPEPIPVWEAVGGARPRLGVDVHQRGGAELVGRRQELDCSSEALARTLNASGRHSSSPSSAFRASARAASSGSSRRAVDEDPERIVFWRQGRSLPYGEGVAFWAVAEMVKAQAGILETDSAETAETKLIETVVGSRPRRRARRAGSRAQLRPLVGVSAEEEGRAATDATRPSPRGGASSRRSPSGRPARARLRGPALGRRQPARLRRLPRRLGERTRRFSSSGRRGRSCSSDGRAGAEGSRTPPPSSLSPALRGGDGAPLSPACSSQTVMPAEIQAPLLARAGGNPLYAEEYARMVSERGVASTDEAPLPETVQGIVAARLDALSAEDKALIQDAAVLGKVFWSGALAAMSGLAALDGRGELAPARAEGVRAARAALVGGDRDRVRLPPRPRPRRRLWAGPACSSRGEASPRGRVDRDARRRPRGPRRDARPPLCERARVRSGCRPGRGAASPTGRASPSARRATAPTASTPTRARCGFYRDAARALASPAIRIAGRLLFRYARSVDAADSSRRAVPRARGGSRRCSWP